MSDITPQSLGLALAPRFLTFASAFERVVSGEVALREQGRPITGSDKVYGFGDSLSDDGNAYLATGGAEPVSPPYSKDFSNGPVWVDDLAASLGLPALGPSLAGGTDFAFGGAETGNDPLHAVTAGDLPTQLAQFEAGRAKADPNALYTVWVGSNDVRDAIGAFPANPRAAFADIGTAVRNEANFLRGLAQDGARNVLVLNVPDLGKTPEAMAAGPAASAVASGLSALFDIELDHALAVVAWQTHLNLHLLDTYSLIDQAAADPALFGFTNVTTPVWSGNYTDPHSGTLASTNPAVQNQYLFWDQLHPTAAGHVAVAQAAKMALL